MTTIINRDESGEKTTKERVEEMIAQLESHFKTGPIIGDSREVIYHLANTVLVSQTIIKSCSGWSDKQMINNIELVSDYLQEYDKEILAKRAANE